MPLPREHLLDEFATAYIQAIAAAAGSTIAVSRRDYGVDGTLKHIVKDGARFIESGFPVDFQLKATSAPRLDGDFVKYDLSVRNYDLIVTRPPAATPYYLFLVCFGSESDSWVIEDGARLILNAWAFWWTLSGDPTDNVASIRIEIPRANRLNSDVIGRMLMASREKFFK
jgi:Domain of unknown function (DUF4365)